MINPEPKPDTSKRLSDKEFEEACRLYETGEAGLVEIAAKFGITRQSMSLRFKSNGIVRNSKAAAAAASAAIAEADAKQERFNDHRGERIERTRTEGYNVLRQARLVAQKIMIDHAKRPGAKMGDIDADFKSIARFNVMMINNIEATLGLLNANNFVEDEDLPTLRIEDLTQEEIFEYHKNTGAIPEDMTLEEMLADEVLFGKPQL